MFCYAEVPIEDATTARFRSLADHWRPTSGRSDADMAAMIRQDRIDVLIDLAGHTAANRLLVFARKPAPVQIEYILGHGYTSGMSAMDGFLADDTLAPPGADALFSEQLIRLSRIPLAYRPPDGHAAGRIVAGRRERPRHLRLFRPAGAAEPMRGRRLVAHPERAAGRAAGAEQPQFRRSRVPRAVRRALSPRMAWRAERLDLIATAPQPRTWEAYGMIDIALDPFPHNAGTTTIEALWQGVPVVTLAGRRRSDASARRSCTRPGWTTGSPAAPTPTSPAPSPPHPTSAALAHLRSSLRARVAALALARRRGPRAWGGTGLPGVVGRLVRRAAAGTGGRLMAKTAEVRVRAIELGISPSP